MNNITVIFDLGNVMVYFDYGHLVHKLAHNCDLDESFIYQQKAQLENILKGFENGEISPEIFTHKVSSALNRKLEIAEFKKIWSDIFTENVAYRLGKYSWYLALSIVLFLVILFLAIIAKRRRK